MSGADNQQERPGFEQWIVGFVDGEGCFSVPIFRQRTARLGWQCQPELAVVQATPSASVLHELQRYFGCGRVGVNRRHDNHRSDMYRWSVRSLDDLTSRILPFFECYSLRTVKATEFDDELSETFSISGILRGHTPATSDRRTEVKIWS